MERRNPLSDLLAAHMRKGRRLSPKQITALNKRVIRAMTAIEKGRKEDLKEKPCGLEILGPFIVGDSIPKFEHAASISISSVKRYVAEVPWTAPVHCNLPKGHKGPHVLLNPGA